LQKGDYGRVLRCRALGNVNNADIGTEINPIQPEPDVLELIEVSNATYGLYIYTPFGGFTLREFYWHDVDYLLRARLELANTYVNLIDSDPRSDFDATVYYDTADDSKAAKVRFYTSWYPYTRVSGTYTTGFRYRIENTLGTEVANGLTEATPVVEELLWRQIVYSNSVTNYGDFEIKIRKYGYEYTKYTRSLDRIAKYVDDSGDVQKGEIYTQAVNIYTVATEAVAAAYTGVSITADSGMAVTGTRTMQELYDYGQAWGDDTGNIQYNEPMITSDGSNFSLSSGRLLSLGLAVSGGINLAGDVELTAVFNLTDHNISGTLDFTVAGTYTINDSIITEVTNSSGGNVIINTTSGLVVTTNTGPNITINAPTTSLTINSDTASSLIRYFEDDSQTATSTTGTSLVYTYPDTDPIDIEVLKQGYVPVNRQDVVPYNDDYNIALDFDEAYNSSHGLVITTDYTYNRTTKVLAIVADQEALDVRSALADLIRTNSSYYNTPLLMDVIGGLVRVDLIDGMTCSDMSKWKGAGSEVYDAADSANPIEKWCAVKTVGSITGATTHYRQTSSGDSTALTLTNNVVNEALQYWSDPDHDGTPATDISDYLLIKAFLAGSKQGRVDILAASGDTELRSTLYQVSLANEDHGYSGADPGITADLTLVAPGTSDNLTLTVLSTLYVSEN